MTISRYTVIAIVAAVQASTLADVVINEVVHAPSERLVRWENGVPKLGTGTQWYEQAFDDAAWQTGPGPFGFGTTTPAAPAFGTNTQTQMQNLTPTLYLRKTFSVSAGDAAKADPLELLASYNDGFILYVNGVEVARRWAGPPNQIHYRDQPSQDPNLNGTTTDASNPVGDATLNSETVNLGAANFRLVPGTNVIAIHALNIGSTNSNFVFSGTLRIGGATPVTLVDATEAWRYFPGVVEPSAGLYDPALIFSAKLSVPWAKVAFDDSTWAAGAGPIGQGVGGMGTTVSGVVGVTPSLYTRVVFNATAVQAADTAPLSLTINFDDAYVAYINGVEVARANLQGANTFVPANAVSSAVRNYGSATTVTLDQANRLLVPGANVLAVQVHNVSVGDSDIAVSAGLQTAGGTTLVAANGLWRYKIGTEEPVLNLDGAIEDNPDEPDSVTDWVELHNNGPAAVSLNGWSLTDDAGEPQKWTFPNVSIPAGGYLVVICDGADITAPTAGGYLHTNFKIDADGEYLALRDSGGSLVQQFTPAIPAGSPFHSYGRNGAGSYVFFDKATPGAANTGNEFPDRAAAPAFSQPGGFYSSTQSISLSSTTPGAQIRYTLDGSEPTETTGILYASPIPVTALSGNKNGWAIRARAFAPGLLASETTSETYLIGITAPQTTLPVVSIIGDEQRSLYRPFGIMAIKNNVAGAAGNYPNGPWSALGDPQQYNNPNFRGRFMERPVIWQMLYPDGSPGFTTEIGVRMAGSPYTRPRYILTDQNRDVNPNTGSWNTTNTLYKPSMNFYMRDDLGGDPLKFPVITGSPVTTHSDFRFRAGHNDMNPFIIDELMRRNNIACGQVGSLGINTTLYINGVYKGIYNLVQHIREEFLQEAYGSDLDWDVLQVAVPADGDLIAFQEMFTYLRNNPQNILANYQGMSQRLDMVNFVDYLITNVYGATGDWPHNNWIAGRERSTAGRWRFFTWDAEGAFGSFGLNVLSNNFTTNPGTSGNQSALITTTPQTDALGGAPRILFTLLKDSPEFRLLFADRIQKHFFNNGALANASISARKEILRAECQAFISGFNNARLDNWINGVGNITRYNGSSNLPSRRQVLLEGYYDDINGGVFVPAHFTSAGLWPATKAPVFSQHGGSVPAGYALTITNPNAGGTIFYTMNGVDPRAAGGAAQGTMYAGAIPITQTGTVMARVLNAGEWSPLIEATFTTPGTAPLIVTEIMYHPPDYTPPGGAQPVNGNEFEFVEIKNTGSTTVNLFGMRFSRGIDFAFPAGASVAPGGFVVIAKNPVQFAQKYPGIPVLGAYGPGSSLNNAGERITLLDASGAIIVDFTYDDKAPWPTSPDGSGYSLVSAQANSNPHPNDPVSWRPSTDIGGSPGADDPPSGIPRVLITEVLANSVAPELDAVEIHNPEAHPADISGWYLSDSLSNPAKFRIPDGTIIPPGGYVVFDETHFNTGANAFAFSRNGDEAVLSSADAAGNPTGYTHLFSFGPSEPGTSFGKYVNSQNTTFTVQLAAKTFGSANAGPKISPVIISEIHYQPAAEILEFIEIRNNSNSPVPLYDPLFPSNTWRLDGVEFTFPPGIVLQPGKFILVSATDPVTARAALGVNSAVQIYGPYQPGNLSNSGERIALQKPGLPYVAESSTVIPYIDMDFVTYGISSPWPTSPAGGGRSLERALLNSFADDPLSWKASSTTNGNPGRFGPASYAVWQTAWFNALEISNPAISGPQADTDLDGIINLLEYTFGLNPRANDSGMGISTSIAMNGTMGPYLMVTHRRNLSLTASTLITVQGASSPAGPWAVNNPSTGTAYFVQQGAAVNNGDGTESRTFRSDLPIGSLLQRFVRIHVSSP